MNNKRVEKIRVKLIENDASWLYQFDVNDYVQNAPMIKQLYTDKQLIVAENLDLKDRVKDLEYSISTLNMVNQRLSSEIEDVKSLSFISFIISLLSTIVIAIGVNIVTSNYILWIGWFCVVIGVIMALISFFMQYRRILWRK